MGPDFAPILKIYFVVRRDRKGDLRFLEAHPRGGGRVVVTGQKESSSRSGEVQIYRESE